MFDLYQCLFHNLFISLLTIQYTKKISILFLEVYIFWWGDEKKMTKRIVFFIHKIDEVIKYILE